MNPSNEFYSTILSKVVNDINVAYDCEGLRRPIIQAAILEKITSMVNEVPIPNYVIQCFSNDTDFNSGYYIEDLDLKFDWNNIRYDNTETPDLTRIETRMWYYYLATSYIDFGFKALHLGHWEIITKEDEGFIKAYDLLTKIRDYADNNNTFVLLDAHTPGEIFYDDTNLLLFDFYSSPIRPLESETHLVGPNCINDLNVELVEGHGDAIYRKSLGGISPLLECDREASPYFVEFDHHHPYCGDPSQAGEIENKSWCVWGYDEATHYYHLSNGCKGDLLKYYYPKVRDFDHRGFLQLPGRHWVGSPALYRINDFPELIEISKDLLEPSLNIGIDHDVEYDLILSWPYLIILRRHTFNATNLDNSSVLTWHTKKPSNSWIKFTYGIRKDIRFPQLDECGNYDLTLRQDNLGLPVNAYGTKLIPLQFYECNPYYVIPLTSFSLSQLNQLFSSSEIDTSGLIDLIDFNQNTVFNFNEMTHPWTNSNFWDIIFNRILVDPASFFPSSIEGPQVHSTQDNPLALSKERRYGELESRSIVTLFPNPSSEILNINISCDFETTSSEVKFEIYSNQGRKVKEMSFYGGLKTESSGYRNSNFQLPVSRLISGQYYLRIIMEGNVVIKPFQIVH